ncbi:hypothetical protein [Flavobacterium sp.]|uniref:hypothetical protein n=1 Tax=Flavobacterium sp. TaxID=239 RepID=UPI00379678E6
MAAFAYTKDSFKFRKNHFNPNIEVMALASSRIDLCIDYIKKNKIQGIEINAQYGSYRFNNLDVLEQLVDCNIKVIELVSDFKDISILNKFNDLEQLRISENKASFIDFVNFPNLKSLGIDDTKNLINVDRAIKLESLGIGTLNKTSKIDFSKLLNLKDLFIVRGNIENLEFLNNLNIEKLSVNYCSKIKDTSTLATIKNSLVDLEFYNCKNIENFEIIGNLENLNWLKLSGLGEIKSLSFIKKLKNLKKLSFVDTNILDGDLSYCEGIEFVGFNNKKHYSHKYEDLAPLK